MSVSALERRSSQDFDELFISLYFDGHGCIEGAFFPAYFDFLCGQAGLLERRSCRRRHLGRPVLQVAPVGVVSGLGFA